MKERNRFVVISPMFNASKTLARMLHSIAGQSYENWKLILIDDVSNGDNVLSCECLINRFKRLDIDRNVVPRVQLIRNVEKKWEVENVLQGLALCDDDDIIVRVDPDDFLTDLDAFRIVNDVYEKTQCEVLWTNHRWHDDERVTFHNISGPMARDADPYKTPWCASHMKTFRKRVLNSVKHENYLNQDGNFFRRIGDQVFMLPALRQARGKHTYIPLVMYSYRCSLNAETFQTEDAKFQRDEAVFLRHRGFIE